ncbi:MAG: Hsp20/alpha crystallin family protein [Spirochaetales bacterium]|nr:Hsp20/alpha crystallin family protein [Spirochaetales bacterium]
MSNVTTLEPQRRMIQPRCAIHEDEGKIFVDIEMPGVEKDGLSIHVENQELIIEGKRLTEAETGRYLLRERRLGDYRKSFTIDDTVDTDKIEAELASGMVKLTLPLKAAVQPRQISIKQK